MPLTQCYGFAAFLINKINNMNKFEKIAKQCPHIQQSECKTIDEQYVGLISAMWAFEYTQKWHPLDTLKTTDTVVLVLYNDTEVTAYLTEITEELITSFGGLKLDKERIKGWRSLSFCSEP